MFVLYSYINAISEGGSWFTRGHSEMNRLTRLQATVAPARRAGIDRQIAHWELIMESGKTMKAQAVKYKKDYFDDLRARLAS